MSRAKNNETKQQVVRARNYQVVPSTTMYARFQVSATSQFEEAAPWGARAAHGVAVLPAGEALLLGGVGGPSGAPLCDVWRAAASGASLGAWERPAESGRRVHFSGSFRGRNASFPKGGQARSSHERGRRGGRRESDGSPANPSSRPYPF